MASRSFVTSFRCHSLTRALQVQRKAVIGSSHASQQQRRTLAGHNKWSKIKRKKGANDVQRSTAHGKAARAIQAAARACSGDMDDLHLQSTIAAAKAMQLPKDKVLGAIERGTKGKGAEDALMDLRYDGMLPTNSSGGGKVALVVTALTDNKNRTAANVRASFRMCGGEMMETGANGWLFDHIGLVIVPHLQTQTENAVDVITWKEEEEDALMEIALESGALDVEFISLRGDDQESENDNDNDDSFSTGSYAAVKCNPSDLHKVVTSLRESSYSPSQFDTRYVVKDEGNCLSLEDELSIDKLEKLLARMDEDDDVTNIYYNAKYD